MCVVYVFTYNVVVFSVLPVKCSQPLQEHPSRSYPAGAMHHSDSSRLSQHNKLGFLKVQMEQADDSTEIPTISAPSQSLASRILSTNNMSLLLPALLNHCSCRQASCVCFPFICHQHNDQPNSHSSILLVGNNTHKQKWKS